MKIAVIGAHGMVGAEIVKEAEARGHLVTPYTRSGSNGSKSLDLAQTEALVKTIAEADVTVISVASRDNYEAALKAHQQLIAAKPQGRILIIGGAGALLVGDSRLVDSPEFPAEYKPEALTFAQILDAYRAATDINWTMLAPSPMITPGQRTGEYRTELDTPAGNFISTQDFAVAAVDEIENPKHQGTRFTAASANESAAESA